MSLQFFINSLNKEIDDSLDDLLLLYNDQLFTKKKVNRLSTQKKIVKERMESSLNLTNQVATIKHACNVIQKELPKIIESEEFLSVIEEFSKSEHSLEEFYTHLQKEEISQDKSYIYQELLGLSDTTLTHCYSLGKNLFEKRKFKDSESIFHFLMLLNPYVTSFWVCAGLSSIMLNDIQEAAHLFHEAKSLHSTQPNIYFYAACCDFLLNNYSSALQELNQAEKLLKLTPDNSTLFPMIERLRYLTVGKKHAI